MLLERLFLRNFSAFRIDCLLEAAFSANSSVPSLRLGIYGKPVGVLEVVCLEKNLAV